MDSLFASKPGRKTCHLAMNVNKEELPVTIESPGATMRSQEVTGSITAALNEFPKVTDLMPLLEGLDNNRCHCRHWGYILEGAMLLKYHPQKK